MKELLILGIIVCFCFSCEGRDEQKNDITLLEDTDFTKVIEGKQVSLYTLESGNGITMQVTNYGGRIVSLWVPDKNNNHDDIVLGHKTIDEYINTQGERYLGPVVGRYANRIAGGKFTLDGETYQLPVNNNGQTLHGRVNGLDRAVWNIDSVSANYIRFSYLSPDGEDGFPGNLNIKMIYRLSAQNELKMEYEATTDKPTVVNLSHHGVFNLKGEGNGTILDHIIYINSNAITPIDSMLIPTGEFLLVEGTPFDFRKPTTIGDYINNTDEQLRYGAGYDHNWVINRKSDSGTVELVATLYEPASGRFMEVLSDQPGLQFYSGNFFNGRTTGKYHKPHRYRESLTLETQKFPDSPNHPLFPSTRLDPGEVYKHTCIYKFSAR